MKPLSKCKCGGHAIYNGVHMTDSYKCSKCNYETPSFFDGEPWARSEWNKRNDRK